MGNNTHKLEIFRGFLKFKSNQKHLLCYFLILEVEQNDLSLMQKKGKQLMVIQKE